MKTYLGNYVALKNVLALRNVLALFVLASLTAGCPTTPNRGLAEGPYERDVLLASYDEIVLDVEEAIDAVTSFADRNPTFVDARPALKEKIDNLRRELDGQADPNETMTKLLLARNAYIDAKNVNTRTDLSEALDLAQTLLNTARGLLFTLNNPNILSQ